MNSFINLEVNYAQKSASEKAADFCLSPVRYLFNGRTVTLLNNNHILQEDRQSFENKCWLTTALSIICIVPALLIGLILKGVSLCFSTTRIHYNKAIAHLIEKAPIALPPPLDDRTPLSPWFSNITEDAAKLLSTVKNKDDWKKPHVANSLVALLERSYQGLELMFRRMYRMAEGYAILYYPHAHVQSRSQALMAQMLLDHYTFPYTSWFIWSMPMIYSSGRYLCFVENDKLVTPPSTLEDSMPFFTPGLAQYRSRRLYNAFVSLFEHYNLHNLFIKRSAPIHARDLSERAIRDIKFGHFAADREMNCTNVLIARPYIEQHEPLSYTDVFQKNWVSVDVEASRFT